MSRTKNPGPDEYSSPICPSCGAIALNPVTVSVTWNAAKKQFVVRASFLCRQCMRILPEGDIRALPLVIAKTSRCSCGETLSLSDHSIKQTKDDIEFKGVYVCSSCHRSKSVIWAGVIGVLRKFWRDTKRVKVGTDGFEYEKK
jgi:ribosomal protein S14